VHDRVEPLAPTAAYHHGRAVPGENVRKVFADAGAAAGDERRVAGEIEHLLDLNVNREILP
jgi:hypothetical protein